MGAWGDTGKQLRGICGLSFCLLFHGFKRGTYWDLVDQTVSGDGGSAFQRQGVSWIRQHPFFPPFPNKFLSVFELNVTELYSHVSDYGLKPLSAAFNRTACPLSVWFTKLKGALEQWMLLPSPSYLLTINLFVLLEMIAKVSLAWTFQLYPQSNDTLRQHAAPASENPRNYADLYIMMHVMTA